ncbi:MAG TPA: hypothetical protein VL484_18290 [Vicinamibacterales bacterium]|jgi:hypothetical protein|nr:hypothetical protein [Vicinamibacterales bacterium]
MAAAPPLGAAMKRLLPVLALFGLLGGQSADAAERYVLIVSGAAGEPQYADRYDAWRKALVDACVNRMAIEPSHVDALFDGGDEAHAASAQNVKRVLDSLRRKMHADDVALVVLIGHGTFDGVEAKFNLVGPDLTSGQWAALLKPLTGRLVLVDTSAASFPFLQELSGPRRIVITATDSGAQRFDTIFPEYFVHAFDDPSSDLDKNGRVSIWEAFLSASLGVRRHYEERGQLATERALLDDDGDGRGREAGEEGTDGAEASRLYLDPDVADAPATDEQLIMLLQKRAALQVDVQGLQQRRLLMTPDEYAREFERLMIELARTTREIKSRQKT